MMISPEGYYEEYLKGKTKEQIMTAIRGLKKEIGGLKNIIESMGCVEEPVINPSQDTRISCAREYLERAKIAYVEAGGKYTLSKSEEKAANFDANMNAICKITFIIGGFFGGYRSYEIDLTDELKASTKLWEEEEPIILLDQSNKVPLTNKIFLSKLTNLHIGEWRRRYSTERFGYMVIDGTQWELEFKYNNGQKTVSFDGNNSYPYNLNKFKALIGIEDIEEDEHEQI